MVRRYLIHGVVVILVAAAALVLIRLHRAQGASSDTYNASEAKRLAEAWCHECHAVDTSTTGTARAAPDFAAIANQPSTTELSLKVLLASSHRNMPNLILSPEQTDILAHYILSLKRK